MDIRIARIARDTCVDVSTPVGSVGCIEFISYRNGVQGAKLSYGNPLCWDDPDWYPLSELRLCGDSARRIVDSYL